MVAFTDAFGPRPTGTQILEESIDFIVDVLRVDGLENVHGEATNVTHWVRGKEYAILMPFRIPI